jgi:hypothetical protein
MVIDAVFVSLVSDNAAFGVGAGPANGASLSTPLEAAM